MNMWYVIALVCAVSFGWLGHRVFNGRKAAVVGGVLLGLALVFYAPWREVNPRPRPSPELHIEVPANFSHSTVILIHDPNATSEITWTSRNDGTVVSPSSGVIRVKSLGALDNQESRAVLSDGKHDWGLLNGSIDGARMIAYDFAENGASGPQLGLMSDDELVRYVRQREAE